MNLKEISDKWQKKWKETDIYAVKEDTTKPKFYILDMFPYPSGAGLHVGHPKGYIASDTLARKKMLEGFNVLHPMGFDTFGLGTENYAIEHKMKPQDVAKTNIETYVKQLEMFGTTYDWNRSVNTADPKYFKRTQWIFLQLYTHYYDEKLGKAMPITDPSTQERLAYVDYKPINRCPKCMTGLANEDLDDGKCERCGSEVEQKPMKQWVLRITKYAERLLSGLDDLQWEESMKDLERNWIGKSEGTQFEMKVDGMDETFSVYTTRIDTVFGMSFVAIAPEHPLVDKITTSECKKEVEKYKEAANKKTQLERTELQKEKTGVFCGAYAVNPFNGEKVPVYVADYVLAGYGTGVVMAVPAHDERDYEFAKKYGIKITQSIMPKDIDREKQKKIFIMAQHIFDLAKINEINAHLLGGLSFPFITGILYREHCDIDLITDKKNIDKWIEVLEKDGFEYTGKLNKPRTLHEFKKEGIEIEIGGDQSDVVPELAINEKDKDSNVKTLFGYTGYSLTKEYSLKFKEYLIKKRQEPKDALDIMMLKQGAYTEKGVLVNSGEFSGLESNQAILAMQERLEKNNIGGKKINYKMQDRVFSRQRYRGEPFPILRKETKSKLEINFYNQVARQGIVNKVKTLETRALNPEEPDRYFGDIKNGDIIKYINKETGASLFAKVTKVYTWANFDKLWNEDKSIVKKIYSDKSVFEKVKTIEDLKNHRNFVDGYVEKIEKNGLVGREFELVQAPQEIIALDEKDLPLLLPDVENYQPTGTEEGPLAAITDWVNVTLPDGTKAKRETNTMPGWAGSSRYWLRYMDVNNDQAVVGKDKEHYRGNVDVYVGGAEHITRHVIYGRFWQKFLYDIGVVSKEEPFQEYHYVGLIMGEDGRKMSKRRGNVVNPDDIINEYGADALRVYEMFMGPFDQSIAWSTNGIKGVKKFLEKVEALYHKIADKEESLETKIILHQSIKKLTDDINLFRFNTSVSQLMILVNHLTEAEYITRKTFESLIILVSPFAPHLAEELWEQLGNEYSIFTKASWPTYDEKCLVADVVTIGVQINGKVRGSLCISKEAEESEVMTLAKADEKIAARIVGEPKKVIYVKGKILNIVV